jgi:hypothetical protein
MQFVNIYLRADSSIIETDNIWHFKHILQYIVISNHHYFPVCNRNCVVQYYFRTYTGNCWATYTGNCWATYTETCVLVFMWLYAIYFYPQYLSCNSDTFLWLFPFCIFQFFTYSFEDLIKTSAIVLYLLFWASNWLSLLDPVQYNIAEILLKVTLNTKKFKFKFYGISYKHCMVFFLKEIPVF